MLSIEGVPDVASCAVVLGDSAHGLYHKCNQSSRMNLLSGLDA